MPEVIIILLIVLALVGGVIGAVANADWRIKMIGVGVIALAVIHLIGVL